MKFLKFHGIRPRLSCNVICILEGLASLNTNKNDDPNYLSTTSASSGSINYCSDSELGSSPSKHYSGESYRMSTK